MLRRVVVVPRHYLEHSVAILSCKLSARHFPSAQSRWGTVAATSPQYSPPRYASWQEEAPAEKSLDSERSPPKLSDSPTRIQSDSPNYLANAFTTFLEHHGRTTELALQSLNSGSTVPSTIRKILQKRRTILHVANFLAASDNPAPCIRLESVCWTLTQHKRYALVLEVCRLAGDSLDTMTGRLLDWRLRALCELENFIAVDTILRDYEAASVKPSRRTWHWMLVAHLRNRNLAGARQCLKLMEQAGFPTDHTTHSIIAANYRNLGQDMHVRDFAISALASLPPSSRTFTLNQLLKTHLFFNDDPGFHQLLSLFDKNAVGPLQILGASGVDKSSPVPLLDSACPISVTPDLETFLLGIRFCIARSDFLTADKIFTFMGQRGFESSPAILEVFLELQFALNRPRSAVFITSQLLTPCKFDDLYDQLQRSKPEPGGHWPLVISPIHPTIGVLHALMRGLLASQGLGPARIILELMQRANIKPDSYTTKILVDHLIHSEKATPSLVLRMLRQISPLLRPSLNHLHAIMGRLFRDEKARLYFARHKPYPDKPSSEHDGDQHSSTNPAAGLSLGRYIGRPNLARSLLRSLESRGIQSDAAMLGLRMRYEGIIRRDTSATIDVYNDMLARGMTPQVYHVAVLIEAFTLRGETEKALEIMRTVKMKPNLVLYTILLQGYAYQRQPRAAAELFQTMIADGIRPDARAISALCDAFVFVRQFGAARKLLLTLWTFVEPFPREYVGLPLHELLKLFRSLEDPSKRRRGVSTRVQLRRDVTKIIRKYKHAAGLPRTLNSSSPEVRRLTKQSIHVSRKR